MVWEALRAQKAKAGRNVAVYLDKANSVEAGVELLGEFAEQGEVVRSATPGGMAASVTYFGPYAGLGAAHDAVHEWSRVNHHQLAGPRWEIYGHWLPAWDADPSQIRTDIFYQVSR